MVLSNICSQYRFSVHNNSCYQCVLILNLTCWPLKFFFIWVILTVLLFGHDIKWSIMPCTDKGLNQEYTMFCVYILWLSICVQSPCLNISYTVKRLSILILLRTCSWYAYFCNISIKCTMADWTFVTYIPVYVKLMQIYLSLLASV
jgi:hypothetical protein